jgi:hypothetical protein
MRVSNSKARQYVEKLEEFQGSNTFGKWLDVGNGRTETNLLYVVYSYGSHFPMYVWDSTEKKWLGNKDKYSQSTTRHQSLLRPSSVGIWYDTNEMKEVIYHGGLISTIIERART